MGESPLKGQAPWKSLLDLGTNALVAITAVALLIRIGMPSLTEAQSVAGPRRSAPPLPTQPVSFEGAAILGNPTANVAIIEFADFQCTYCDRFATGTFRELVEKYVNTGKVILAFREMPLPIHPRAQEAAEAAECAAKQGKFWPYHDRLFSIPGEPDRPALTREASAVGLNPQAFATCLDGQTRERVKADVEQGKALGIQGTPTFFLGAILPDSRLAVKDRIVGALPLSAFSKVLDDLLSR